MTTALRHLVPQPQGPYHRIRELVHELAPGEGHTALRAPDICLYRFSAPTTYVKAAHYGITLGIVVDGAKRVRAGGQELVVDPGRLIVLTREGEHQAQVIEATRARPYLGLGICFQPESVARALLALAEAGGATEAPDGPPAFTLPPDDGLGDAVERLLRTVADPLDRKLLAPLILDEILLRLLRTEAAAAVRGSVGSAGDADRILGAMQYIRQNLTDKLTVDKLARLAGMSPSHFAHRFSAVARTSPMRYLRGVRLDAARVRLLGRGARVSQVAVDVGFESAAHFTREFKRRFGQSPSKALAPLAPR